MALDVELMFVLFIVICIFYPIEHTVGNVLFKTQGTSHLATDTFLCGNMLKVFVQMIVITYA